MAGRLASNFQPLARGIMSLCNQEKIDQIDAARYVDNLSSSHVPIFLLHRVDMIIKFMSCLLGHGVEEQGRREEDGVVNRGRRRME